MKRFFANLASQLAKHQAGVLSISLTLMFSFSIMSLVDSFNRLA